MTEVQAQAADLLKVLNRLIEVLQRETELMRQMDPQAMQTLQHDKIVLTAAYESMLQRFRDNPALLSQQDDGLRERIMQASAAFQNTLTENARALYAMKEANERLFRAIIKAIEDQRDQPSSYSAYGAFAKAGSGGKSPAQPVALDARL